MNYQKTGLSALTALLSLSGCASLTTTQRSIGLTKSPPSGIPYNLPTTAFVAEIESVRDDKGKFKELQLVTGSEFIPDRNKRYLINLKESGWFATDKTINVKNGLITTVDSTDDSKAIEIIEQIGKTAVSIAGIAGYGGLTSFEQFYTELPLPTSKALLTPAVPPLPPLKPEPPTNAEIIAAYELIAPGKHSFRSVDGKQLMKEPIPGTANLVWIQGSINIKTPTPLLTAPTIDSSYKESGLLTRTVTMENAKAELSMSYLHLYKNRLKKAEAQVKSSEAAIIINNGKLKEARAKLPTAKPEEKKKIQAEIDKLVKSNVTEENKKTDATNAIPNLKRLRDRYNKINKFVQIYVKQLIVPTTVDNDIVLIPATRSALGKSTNTIKFNQGVFISAKNVKPSSMLELAKSPAMILSSLFKIPAEFIKVRIDTADKKQTFYGHQAAELENKAKIVKAQTDIVTSKTALNAAKKAAANPVLPATQAPSE